MKKGTKRKKKPDPDPDEHEEPQQNNKHSTKPPSRAKPKSSQPHEYFEDKRNLVTPYLFPTVFLIF